MKIAQIVIKNILGLKSFELTPGGFTEIAGKNGQGKTSILEAIKGALKSGHDATLLRTGEEKGEVVLVLDDGATITKTVKADKSETDYRDAGGKKVPRPAEAIKQLADMLSVNPVSFLTADKKDRTRVLLESMPLEADAARLSKISGIKVTAEPGVHALQVIQNVHKQVYDSRTGTNRAVKEKEATIKQLTDAMPEAPAGVEGDENDIAAKIEEARTAKDGELDRINTKLEGLRNTAALALAERRAKLQEAIDQLKADAQVDADKITADLAENERKAGIVREKAVIKFNDTTAPLTAALHAIRENRGNAAKREQALETIEQMKEELEGLVKDADAETKALAGLEAYKLELLKGLPIPGLEVKDGEIYRDGVPFDRLNTAQQHMIAVELAKLRAGELGVVCVDRIECMDSESMELLASLAAENGLQLFVTRVSDDDLSISTTGTE